MKDKSSETIPEGSREETPEMVATFYFYVLVDPFDNQIKYVGRTVDLGNRFRNHIYEAKKNNRNKRERWIVSLMRKNSKPLMKVVYQEVCSTQQAICIERMLIKKVGKRFKLKNDNDHALGGSISTNTVFQYTLDGDYLAEYINSNEAMRKTGVKDCNILRCCKNENGYGTKTAGGYFWSFIRYGKYPHSFVNEWRKLKGKPVKATKDGVDLVFNSARVAEKALGVSYKKISACCNGKQKLAGGYTWSFIR